MRARFAYRIGFFVSAACAVANLVVLVRVWRLGSSPISYNVNVSQRPVPLDLPPPPALDDFLSSTNSSPSPLSVTGGVSSVARSVSGAVYRVPYHVFYVGSVPVLEMSGRYYSSGDVCAYGVVDRIFREAVYLSGGDRIEPLSDFRSESLSGVSERGGLTDGAGDRVSEAM